MWSIQGARPHRGTPRLIPRRRRQMRNTVGPRQPCIGVDACPLETPFPHRTADAQVKNVGSGLFRRHDLRRRSMSGFSRLPLPRSVATVVVIKERERQPMDAAHSLLLSPQSPRPALLSPICHVVSLKRRGSKLGRHATLNGILNRRAFVQSRLHLDRGKCRDAAQIEHFHAQHIEQTGQFRKSVQSSVGERHSKERDVFRNLEGDLSSAALMRRTPPSKVASRHLIAVLAPRPSSREVGGLRGVSPRWRRATGRA